MDLSHWLERHADFTPAKPAVHGATGTLTYAELLARTRAMARGLKHGLHVSVGDRVAFLGYNSVDFLALLFAAARLGAMVVPLNWRLAPAEHAYILGDAGTTALFCEPEFQKNAEAALADPPACQRIACGFAAPGWQALEALLADASGDDTRPEAGPQAPVLVVYTSGTTGYPKGAVLTQGALTWNAVNATHMHDLTSADHVLTALPLFHVGGLNIQTMPALHAGATVTLHRRFEPAMMLDALATVRPTLTVLVPATIQALIDHPQWLATDISSLRMVATGSSVVPLHLIEALHARGIPAVQVYGSTETAPVAAYLRSEDAMRKVGSTGKAALHCDLRIVDDAVADVPAGAAGEILVRGPNVMREYWNDAQATDEALRDGWFHSGDIGHVDDEGYLYFDERKKDVIVSGGENIYPAELELILHEAPFIAAAAVVGRPDEKWGEVPVAIVQPTPGAAPSSEEVLALFTDRLARFKHPREVVLVESLPRNAMGKVQKFRLRDMLADE